MLCLANKTTSLSGKLVNSVLNSVSLWTVNLCQHAILRVFGIHLKPNPISLTTLKLCVNRRESDWKPVVDQA